MIPEDIFKSGTLEMSASPAGGLAEAVPWGDLLTNRILAVLAVFLLILNLSELFRLAPHLLYSIDRSRGSADLEHSLSLARSRNTTALCFALPFCLAAARYALFRPGFWSAIPAQWSAPATIGVLAAFLLLRAFCFALMRPRRLSGEETATLRHLGYNYFILMAALTLLSAAFFSILHVPDALCRTILLWEIGLVWLFTLIRSGQFLDAHCMGFTTFLYLCGLEIVPAALLVAVVLLF